MLVSLCNELVFLRYQELDFQFDENSCKSTSRYMYTLVLVDVSKAKNEAFQLKIVPMVV